MLSQQNTKEKDAAQTNADKLISVLAMCFELCFAWIRTYARKSSTKVP